eukprot:TRINITY_DN22409_c0_g2_i7.p1 TRINITY_DN22409_c0_g2~~TRINITY_DN22409_c0_g2_i7.p1  ORF type:complete len:524 (+),score=82.41 TRINITY_DN22409_c0_g2_i7:2-1573(+)
MRTCRQKSRFRHRLQLGPCLKEVWGVVVVRERLQHREPGPCGGAMPLPPGIVSEPAGKSPHHRRELVDNRHISSPCNRPDLVQQPVTHLREYSVLVIGLLPGTTVQDVKEALATVQAATPHDIYLPFSNGEIGFVRYRDPGDAEALIELSGRVIVRGAPVALTQANDNKKASHSKVPVAWAEYAEEAADDPPNGGWRGKPTQRAGARGVEWQRQEGQQCWTRGHEGGVSDLAGSDQKAASPTRAEVSLMITGLPPDANRRQLMDALFKAGVDNIADLYVPSGRHYGFVRFSSFGGAYRAYQRLRCGLDFEGLNLAVQVSRRQPRRNVGLPLLDKRRGRADEHRQWSADFMEGADAVDSSLLDPDVEEEWTAAVEAAVEAQPYEQEGELESQAQVQHATAESELRQAHAFYVPKQQEMQCFVFVPVQPQLMLSQSAAAAQMEALRRASAACHGQASASSSSSYGAFFQTVTQQNMQGSSAMPSGYFAAQPFLQQSNEQGPQTTETFNAATEAPGQDRTQFWRFF